MERFAQRKLPYDLSVAIEATVIILEILRLFEMGTWLRARHVKPEPFLVNARGAGSAAAKMS
jgi:hypothetical protein